MSRIILVTGGARSGKSAYAESLFRQETHVVYIATAQAYDDEMRARIKHHQQARPESWITCERPTDLSDIIGSAQHYLLDCISVFVSNVMFEMTNTYERISAALQQDVESRINTELETMIDSIRQINAVLALVTNEVGDSIVPEHHVARVYRDILGRVNQHVAALCDEVYFVVCGIPMRLK